MSLPNEVRAKYIEIVDDILAKSDLTAVTEKSIRNGIQERVEYDITPQKAAIKQLIMERFDIFNAKQNRDTEPVPSVETATAATKTNGHTQSRSSSASEAGVKREAEPSDSEDDTVYDAPPKKKRKDNSKDIAKETDAEIAARLQAQEDRAARPTRGAAPRKAAPAKKKKTPKKKTAARVTGSDDSDVEDGGGTGRKVNRETGFHKPMNLSATAAEFFGVPQLSRPQVTKQVWTYIKDRQLQDESDKRYILCDDKLKALLKQDKVHMFQMTKILSTHMYNPEE